MIYLHLHFYVVRGRYTEIEGLPYMTRPKKDGIGNLAALIEQISPRLPTDMIIFSFSGEKLILRAGLDSSLWSDLELIFHEVAYMALPTYMNSVTIRIGAKKERDLVRERCNALSDTDHVIELIEDEDWPEGEKRHLIAAGSLTWRDLSDQAAHGV